MFSSGPLEVGASWGLLDGSVARPLVVTAALRPTEVEAAEGLFDIVAKRSLDICVKGLFEAAGTLDELAIRPLVDIATLGKPDVAAARLLTGLAGRTLVVPWVLDVAAAGVYDKLACRLLVVAVAA